MLLKKGKNYATIKMEKYQQTEKTMEIKTGDILRMKKPHPCSSVYLTVLRTGSDIKVREEVGG